MAVMVQVLKIGQAHQEHGQSQTLVSTCFFSQNLLCSLEEEVRTESERKQLWVVGEKGGIHYIMSGLPLLSLPDGLQSGIVWAVRT